MVAQELVKRGVMWREGNGRDVRVWGDRWLPCSSSHGVISPRLFLHEDTRVGELIDTEGKCWKSSGVDSIFLPHEAEAIKSIPLSVRLPPDKLVWAKTTNSKFTVKNAYRLAVSLSSSDSSGSASNCSQLRRFWRRLWGLLFLLRLSIFLGEPVEMRFPQK